MAWPTDALVAVTDLENSAGGSLKEWVAGDDAEVRTVAGLMIAQGHQQVLDELNDDLPALYRDMNGDSLMEWTETGYSLTWLDTVVQTLPNPAVLKGWELAVCLFWLANSLVNKFQTVSELQVNVMVDQRKFWGGVDGKGGQAGIKKRSLYAQLQIAAQVPGQQTDFNRIRTQDRILRR